MDIKIASNKKSNSANYSKAIDFNTFHGKIVYTWLVFMLGMVCGSLYIALVSPCLASKDAENITSQITCANEAQRNLHHC